jgi:hypothetical protein
MKILLAIGSNRRPSVAVKKLFLPVLIAVGLVVPAATASSAAPRISARAAGCSIGHTTTIKKGVFAARTKKAYDAAVKAVAANDSYAFRQLLLSGKFVFLHRGVRVLIIDMDFTHVKARVMRDPWNSRLRYMVVWIDCSWVN